MQKLASRSVGQAAPAEAVWAGKELFKPLLDLSVLLPLLNWQGPVKNGGISG